MAASGSGSDNFSQHLPVANAKQTLLKTIPSDFRFKTIGQAPGLLHRITTPDPEVPLSASPSPSASPKLRVSQSLTPDNQVQMKPKASLLERMTGPSAGPPPQAQTSGSSQLILAAQPTRANMPTETVQSTATSTRPRSPSLATPVPDGSPNTASKALPKLDTAPEAPPQNSAMDIDSPVNGGQGSIVTSENMMDQNTAASSSSTAPRVNQPAVGQPLSPYAALRNRIDGISQALSNLPTVDTGEAGHLLELATAQSAAALQSANHAQERTQKAFESLQEAMRAVADCILRVQESDTRTNAAMTAVAALTGTRYEEERQRFIAPILNELAECRQSLDRMEERYQKQRHMRAQRQTQVATQPAPVKAAPVIESVAIPAAASPTTPVAVAAVGPSTASLLQHAALQPSGSSAPATGLHAAELGLQAVSRPSPNGGEKLSTVPTSEQKEGNEDLTVEEALRLIAMERKKIEEQYLQQQKEREQQRREHEERARRLNELAAALCGQPAREKQKTAAAVAAEGMQPRYAEGPHDQRLAIDQPKTDHMMVDGDCNLERLEDETRSAAQSEIRQRMIKERLLVERQAAEHSRSEEDKPMEPSPSTVEEESLPPNDADGHRRGVQQQTQFTVLEGAKRIGNRRTSSQQMSPTETSRATMQHNNESAFQTTGTLVEQNTTKPPRQSRKVTSRNVPLGTANESSGRVYMTGAEGEIHRVNSTNSTSSQSRPNTLSPITRYHPLPNDTDAFKHHQQVAIATIEHSHFNAPTTANAAPFPATMVAGLPPQPLSHQAGPAAQILAAQTAASSRSQQAVIPSLTSQYASQPVASLSETRVVVKREPDQDEEDIRPAQCDATAPMTPDSLPADTSVIKREGSVSIPRLSLPSPPLPDAQPTGEVFPQASGQQQKAVDDTRLELRQQIQTTYIASGTQRRDTLHAPDIGDPVQQDPGSFTSQTTFSAALPRRPIDAPKGPSAVPSTQPLAMSREYTPSSPTIVTITYPSSLPALTVTEAHTEARINLDSAQGRAQPMPENHSLSSLDSDRSTRNHPGPQRRIGSDHYSPSPPPRRSRSRSRSRSPVRRSRSRSSRPLPPRGDHYSPRRPSPAPRFSGGYSRYSADRSRSRGPMSATNSRNPSPRPYSPAIGYRQPPLAPANHGQKRSHAGDLPQGPPSRRPRYDDRRDDILQTNSSTLQVPRREIFDQRSVITNNAPLAAEYVARPLGERLGRNAPSDAFHLRGRQAYYDESNNRHVNRRHGSDGEDRHYSYDLPRERRPLSPDLDILPPLNATGGNATGGASRPNLLSRLGDGNLTHDEPNSYFHQQSTNHHHSNPHNSRGGPNPRRGRGNGPITPRGGRNSLINRIEG